jgi:hypothetical protein
METITLLPDGRITKKDKPVTVDILPVLSSTVCLATDVTLGSFFDMVQHYPDLMRISPYLEPLMKIIDSKDGPGMKTEEISHLVFYKTVAMKGFPGTPRVEIYNSLKGIQDNGKKPLNSFQVETLAGHDLTLGKLEHVIFGDGQDMFVYDTCYTLFELVEGIAWDLSFCFNPIQCTLRR